MTWIIFTQQEIFTLQENQLFFLNLFQISKLSIYNTEYPPPPPNLLFLNLFIQLPSTDKTI